MSKPELKKALHATIMNHTLAIRTIKPGPEHDLFVLKPGANVVSPEVAVLIKGHPTIKIEIEAGRIEVLGEHEEGGEALVLEGLKPKEQIDVVKKTTDLALLKAWSAKCKNKEVRAAIKEQIEELGKPTEFREPASGDAQE